ncbi:rhamnogalacturonan acetylesterase [Galbibacter sp. EGI 63066]|uniref:rhamnogalacturonan acetylesterase n=1 Tax=Galbibacter sp. EGI 63066 TaxID=2993559 RepID=UPI0022489922|nr:rhamnogalacturonan acetylesterase [Galbibacter sp. EGI 63066]MCX2678595.1 rhamnogalacturonan acetylesterase [Galbibacter sp. EGI 63066]
MYRSQFCSFILCVIFSFSACAQSGVTDGEPIAFKFGYQKGSGAELINSPTTYKSGSFGFDFNTEGAVAFEENTLLAKESVYFSIELPEGNYKIDIELGSEKTSSVNTIKAESRRIMVSEESCQTGETVAKSFVVNLRSIRINNDDVVRLKDREKAQLNWDDKLTLEFSKGTAVRSIKITPVNSVVTLFLAGDSTVTDQDLEPWASWGQMIPQYFNDQIVVANYASSGASLSSFKWRKRLDKILSVIKEGDFLMIEFGHNDEKQKGEGKGPWLHYTDLLTEYATKAREKGATPILLTPTQRRHFNEEGKLKDTHGDFPPAMRKVAGKLNIPLIDLTKMTTVLYETWRDDVSRKAFVQYPANTFPGQNKKLEDNTHFNMFGAHEIALCVLSTLQQMETGVEKYISIKINYNPEKSNSYKDWTLPMSPRFEATKPDGN